MKNVETEVLIMNVVNMYHLQLGTKDDPFLKPKVRYHTDSKWLQEFLNAMNKYKVTIYRPKKLQLPLNRKNDQNIMDTMIEQGYGYTDLRRINMVRQYLHVINLSDVSDSMEEK